MRSFKAKVLSACAWAAPLFAAVLPSQHEVGRPNGRILQLEHQDNYAQATFSIPCTGCLGSEHTGQDDEALILNFKTYGQDQDCGTSNITLNGVDLPLEWDGDFAFGSASHNYTDVANLPQDESALQHGLDLEWNSSCLHGLEETDESAQVLTVNIKAIDGKTVEHPSGFTVSFKQQYTPSLLRLTTVPDPLASDKQVAESWRNPPVYLRLIGPDVETVDLPHNASLQDDIRELEALQAELRELQRLIAQKSSHIYSRFRKERQPFSGEVGHCQNVSCIVKAVANRAHGVWEILVVHLQPHHYSDQATAEMSRPVFAPARSHALQKDVGRIEVVASTSTSTSQPRPYEASTNELPPRPRRKAPYILALEITLSVLCCGCVIAFIRHKCTSLRTKTERLADSEERLTARAYARAARQHAWRNWWRGNWRKPHSDHTRMADYEEKRALISAQEDILEAAMQQEIRLLREAHTVVEDLVRDAEEGRVVRPSPRPCDCPHHRHNHPVPPPSPLLSTTSTYPPTSLPEIPSRPLSRTDSLPSYRSDPPAYESDVDMSEVVANGLNFRVTQVPDVVRRTYALSLHSEMSRWTPESSVVDVSPRPSAETLRSLYPLSVFTADEEDGEEEED